MEWLGWLVAVCLGLGWSLWAVWRSRQPTRPPPLPAPSASPSVPSMALPVPPPSPPRYVVAPTRLCQIRIVEDAFGGQSMTHSQCGVALAPAPIGAPRIIKETAHAY